MKFNNLINLTSEQGILVGRLFRLTLEPDGRLPLLVEAPEIIGDFLGFPVTRKTSVVEGLPEQQEGTLLLVSEQVRRACPERKDLASIEDGRLCVS